MTSHNLFMTGMITLGFLIAASVGRAAEPVPGSAKDIRPILVGSELPKLTLKSMNGSTFDVNAAVKLKPTVLIYYRGGW